MDEWTLLRSRMWHDVTDHARPFVQVMDSVVRKTVGPIIYAEPNVSSFMVRKEDFPNAMVITVTETPDGLRVDQRRFEDVPDEKGRSTTEPIDFIVVNGEGHFKTNDGKVMNLLETIQYLILPIASAA